MGLFRAIAKWLCKHFISFLVIVGVLVVGRFLQGELQTYASIAPELVRLQQLDNELSRFFNEQKTLSIARVNTFKQAAITDLDARIQAINQEVLALKAGQQCREILDYLQQCFVHDMKSNIAMTLLMQERKYLEKLREIASFRWKKQIGGVELERLRKVHVATYALVKKSESQQTQLKKKFPYEHRIPWTLAYTALQALEEAHRDLYANNDKAHKQYQTQRRIFDLMQMPRDIAPFAVAEQGIDKLRDDIQSRRSVLDAKRRTNLWNQLAQPVSVVIPTALLILLAIILTPLAVKAFLYFLIAPVASRRSPVRLMPDASGSIEGADELEHSDVTRISISAVSQVLTVSDTDELLIHPEYIQSSSQEGTKDTKWLLDWSYPLSSVASGMFALTRFRPGSSGAYALSAMQDPLSEVGVISLPAGSAVVLQPHCLVGVVQRREHPVTITRHWRLGSLHAWLTLQLRYLIFHGPVKLIVKGCRGVSVERAGTGRSINQAATIGFSANIAYATTRCETFWAYFTGKQELFNDHFPAGPGCFIYEETPHFGQITGITGRGLEGIADSVLKVFGI